MRAGFALVMSISCCLCQFHSLWVAISGEIQALRIDNSRRGGIHSLWNISKTTKTTTSCDISNERAYFSACVDISGL